MAERKRQTSPSFIENPLIKKRNLSWTVLVPADSDAQHDDDLSEPISPAPPEPASAAAIESGQISVDDHLERFVSLLSDAVLPQVPSSPRLSVADYAALYTSNAGSPLGAHFVIHQHDHPIAGTHYDLRLQINPTSSASWAIMYGMPGDPNSVRLNRNATETRVHSLWNHLIETASRETGSLLIWDTGTYTVLPRRSKHAPTLDPSSQDDEDEPSSAKTQQELLHEAFQNRKIKIQLLGTKLPQPYVVYLRLTKTEDAAGRAKADKPRKRRRRQQRTEPETTDSSPSSDGEETIASHATDGLDATNVSAEERELRELEDEHVHNTNAYTGAVNSIGSVHQRRWYLSLDRAASGLKLERGRWNSPEGYPFHVHGRHIERSVVTGRLGEDVLRDEGVAGFTPRQGWKPVVK